MANVIFNKFKHELFLNGLVAWTGNADGSSSNGGGTFKVALMSNAYTPNSDTQNFWNQISSQEVTGAGYTAGGITLTSKTATRNDGTDQITLDAADVSWPNSTITNARHAVVYRDTGTPSTSYLVAAYDFGVDKSSSNDTFTFTINAAGLIILT